MPFSFANLFALLTSAPAIIAEGEQVVSTVVTDAQALLTNPAVQQLEAFFASVFTHVTTPGSAAIIEPKVGAPKGK